MDEMNEIYQYIGNVLNKNMNVENWEKIQFNIKASIGYCGFDGIFIDSLQNYHDLDIDIPYEMGGKIRSLLELSKKNNFAPWNRAVYTLERDGQFNMEFEWDQALQDKWDNP